MTHPVPLPSRINSVFACSDRSVSPERPRGWASDGVAFNSSRDLDEVKERVYQTFLVFFDRALKGKTDSELRSRADSHADTTKQSLPSSYNQGDQ